MPRPLSINIGKGKRHAAADTDTVTGVVASNAKTRRWWLVAGRQE